MACCDCGLVHDMDFRIVGDKAKRIEFRVARNNRSTGQVRRWARKSQGTIEAVSLTGNNGSTGRPKGSRNKLGEAFLEAMHADFEQHGVEVIKTGPRRKAGSIFEGHRLHPAETDGPECQRPRRCPG